MEEIGYFEYEELLSVMYVCFQIAFVGCAWEEMHLNGLDYVFIIDANFEVVRLNRTFC